MGKQVKSCNEKETKNLHDYYNPITLFEATKKAKEVMMKELAEYSPKLLNVIELPDRFDAIALIEERCKKKVVCHSYYKDGTEGTQDSIRKPVEFCDCTCSSDLAYIVEDIERNGGMVLRTHWDKANEIAYVDFVVDGDKAQELLTKLGMVRFFTVDVTAYMRQTITIEAKSESEALHYAGSLFYDGQMQWNTDMMTKEHKEEIVKL